MSTTYYRCATCGDTTDNMEDESWLIAPRVGHPGHMVIRCPEHITEYAIRQAGGRMENGQGWVRSWGGAEEGHQVVRGRR